MVTQLLDVFGFLSVLLRGAVLTLNSLMVGGAVFLAWALRSDVPYLTVRSRHLVMFSAVALAVVQMITLAADSAILAATAGTSLWDAAGASFFLAGAVGAAAGLTVAGTAGKGNWALVPCAISTASLVATSHAMGRVEHRALLMTLAAFHQTAAAAWIGGLPYLALVLIRCGKRQTRIAICRRFSVCAVIAVAALAASGAAMSTLYIDSPSAAYGTAYGAMLTCKVVLTIMLLVLGGMNRRTLRRPIFRRIRSFTEAEIGIGVTAILVAASLTSQPPSADLQTGRLNAAEVVARFRPQWPRLTTPPLSDLSPPSSLSARSGREAFVPGDSYTPNRPGDIAWSEYNHHWAGLIVMSAGSLALLARTGRGRWAQNWPLVFVGLAIFILIRADPENWPLGPRGFWQSFAVADVLQHRIFVVLILAFAGFEWGVRTGRLPGGPAALVFPIVCAIGGALLLTHSHPIGNIKESLLAELSHLPLAVLAVAAGWSRWIELRGDRGPRPIAAWIWPICLLSIGAVLLNYREA